MATSIGFQVRAVSTISWYNNSCFCEPLQNAIRQFVSILANVLTEWISLAIRFIRFQIFLFTSMKIVFWPIH